VPGRISGPYGGAASVPSATISTELDAPSRSRPSASRIASVAPFSDAAVFASTFASSAVLLMSQRRQRSSGRVIAATPATRTAGSAGASDEAIANTVGARPGAAA
jgi:hypothetical protein